MKYNTLHQPGFGRRCGEYVGRAYPCSRVINRPGTRPGRTGETMLVTLHRILTISRSIPDGSPILHRLANVIYWLGCAGGTFACLAGVLTFLHDGRFGEFLMLCVLGSLIWGAGRTINYILTGR